MTGNTINTKTEALELHELSSEALDAVSGGGGDTIRDQKREQDKENAMKTQENKQQLGWIILNRQLLMSF